MEVIDKWNGKVFLNDEETAKVDFGSLSNGFKLRLVPKWMGEQNAQPTTENHVTESQFKGEMKITVKSYMTQQATPEFDFMAKWNNNNPMPLRTMVGTVEKETRGMQYMHLHGMGEPVIRCLRCGKELTNPISRHYGIGPDCMAKIGIVANINDEDNIREQLVNLTWEGWVVKSAITEKEIL